MLKIKNGIKWEELEKIGFENHQLFMYKIIEKNDNSSWGLHIEKKNRLISIDYYENSIERRISIIHNLDLLYDLFELKFIEKFEEEN